MSDNDFHSWFDGKELSTDWTSRYFHQWASLLESRKHEPLDVLEIGSWEGRSAIFFLRFLSDCHLTCIDTFQGSPEHRRVPKWAEAVPHIERRFDGNLAEFGCRVAKIKAEASLALAQLINQNRQFDVAYIDGGHASADVLSNAVMVWPMMRNGGIVIFDDYEWSVLPDELDRPKLAIDSFLRIHAGQYRELHRGYQVIIEKGVSPLR